MIWQLGFGLGLRLWILSFLPSVHCFWATGWFCGGQHLLPLFSLGIFHGGLCPPTTLLIFLGSYFVLFVWFSLHIWWLFLLLVVVIIIIIIIINIIVIVIIIIIDTTWTTIGQLKKIQKKYTCSCIACIGVNRGCVLMGWFVSRSFIQDHLDHGISKESMNPCPE